MSFESANTIEEVLNSIYQECKNFNGGALADYIPELTEANPDWYGIALVTTDGFKYCIGKTDQGFTIQSISKPFTYGMILDAYGEEAVSKKVGVEPSGEAFNQISLDPETGRPFNPMINAGAIAAASQVQGQDPEERYQNILECYSSFAGRELSLDEAVYNSESSTGFRNRAIAYLLRNSEIISDPVDENCELYFKQCSINVNCLDLATMGATLANGGVNPITGKRSIQSENVPKVLSVMGSCGMYDGSGQWIYDVGLPSKSGVGGGIIGVLPGQMGLAVFSPPLDEKGNSVRGVKTFETLSKRFGLHLFNLPPISNSTVRSARSLADIDTNQSRPIEEVQLIREYGAEVVVIEVQGDLFFSSMERVLRSAQEEHREAQRVIIDFSRVGMMNDTSRDILQLAAQDFTRREKTLHLIDPKGLLCSNVEHCHAFRNREDAIEDAEANLIRKYKLSEEHNEYSLDEFEVFSGLNEAELELVAGISVSRSFKKGEVIIREGDSAEAFYLLSRGVVGIFVSEDGSPRGIRKFHPGVSFGDLAILDEGRRSADVVAAEDSICFEIAASSFLEVEKTEPLLFTKLLKNLFRTNIRNLRESTRQLASLKAL